jgi:hypothetical protein
MTTQAMQFAASYAASEQDRRMTAEQRSAEFLAAYNDHRVKIGLPTVAERQGPREEKAFLTRMKNVLLGRVKYVTADEIRAAHRVIWLSVD